MEDARVMAIRRSERTTAASPAPLPPSSRRRRSGTAAAAAAAAASTAWPAFPGEPGLGIGCGKLSPAAVLAAGNIPVDGSCSSRSPLSSSSSRLASSAAAAVGAGIRRNSSDLAGDRVCIGAKSPGIVKKSGTSSCSSSSCCDSCRPCSCSSRKGGGGNHRIEYSDVFGGPPKYLTSGAAISSGSGRKSAAAAFPDYDDIFQGSSSARHASKSSTTKSRAAELPVFDLPDLRDSGDASVFKSSPAAADSCSPCSPTIATASTSSLAQAHGGEEIVYDDVFGGPLTGPRTKLLKDLLRCSGLAEAKQKTSGIKPKVACQSDSSPVSSIHSMYREQHGNPIYEYESEVYGDAKHFNSPLKSSLGSVDKSPQRQTFVEFESGSRKLPAVTSVSGSSSPFTEQFDDSTVHSYSTRASNKGNAKDTAAYDRAYKPTAKAGGAGAGAGAGGGADRVSVPVAAPKIQSFRREVDAEVASSSSSETSEQEYLRKLSAAARQTYKAHRKHRSSKPHRRSSRTRREAASATTTTAAHATGRNNGLGNAPAVPVASAFGDSSAAEQEFDYDVELSTDPSVKCFPRKGGNGFAHDDGFGGKKQEKRVDFLTVNHVQLTTEPTVVPPARPAPSKSSDFLSENEFLETDAFMEYSIKDLDGLVAEEYVVSPESVSESSPSVSNSIKTSPSGRSYEDEDSDHCYAKDAVSPDPDPEPGTGAAGVKAEQAVDVPEVVEDKIRTESEEKVLETDTPKVQSCKSSPEETSSSSMSAEEQVKGASSTNVSDDLSSLCDFEVIKGENAERRRSRWERHQRAVERVAQVLAEKNNRDLEIERIQEEKQRVAELLDDVIKRWAAGKHGNLRALLSTLQYILWPECGWQPVSLIDIIEPAAVRKAYKKATLYVHPDKLQQKNASTEHKYIAEKVFDLLQEAWTSFNLEQVF